MKHLSLLLLMAISCVFVNSNAQEGLAPEDTVKHWTYTGLASINFSQTSFSENWQAGGESSVAGLGLFNLTAKYKKNRSAWDNVLDIKYGLTKQKSNKDPRKSDDNFEILSKYGYKAFEHWYYSATFNFKTQMTNGYKEANPDSAVISKALAPAYILLYLGMDYKPNDNFSLVIAPVTGKITIVNDDQLSAEGRFGVEPGENSRFEFGGLLKSTYTKEVLKNVTLASKLGLFYNYLDDPQLDVDWELLVNMKINKFLSANIVTQLIYDKDQVDEVQFKEILGVGLTYTF
ncbi:MAG: DUF3078 domain-containing protein [Bacteroidales bacterium]|nr:DUF3078 domain-containing protein [Bacteroidales bacterium]